MPHPAPAVRCRLRQHRRGHRDSLHTSAEARPARASSRALRWRPATSRRRRRAGGSVRRAAGGRAGVA